MIVVCDVFHSVSSMIRQMKENMKTEEAIMKEVKGWKAGESVYHTERWVAPHSTELEKL
jgi:NADH dehydrogenase (ubiquinone) 1 alpha subcomplex subunit 13